MRNWIYITVFGFAMALNPPLRGEDTYGEGEALQGDTALDDRGAANRKSAELTDGRLSVLMGISGLENSGALSFGLEGKYRFYQFLGIEVFGFRDVLRTFEDPKPGTKLYMQYAAFGHATAGIPVRFLTGSIRPKVGVGYGVRGAGKAAFEGVTGLVGLEGQFEKVFHWNIDYQRGLSGQVTENRQLLSGQEFDVQSKADTYQQFGITMGIYVTEELSFGAKYINTFLDGNSRSHTLLQLSHDL